MYDLTPQSLTSLAAALTEPAPPAAPPPRLMSIWEITSWVLPMAPEHLRRVLAAEPALPQGVAGSEGGTRWFTLAETATLRAHFIARSRRPRYEPARTAPLRAPLIALTGPQGQMGRSVALMHLATAASLAGYRVLVVDGCPAGQLARTLQAKGSAAPGTVLSLIARSAGQSLRRLNEGRLDRGEAPVPMEPRLGAALSLTAADLIRPTVWPGLDLLAADAGLMQADLAISTWRLAQPRWRPWRAVAEALDSDGLRQRYDLILCDTARGLGPLALSLLASADMLLAPLPLQATGLADLGAGLLALGQAMAALQDEMQTTARALGQSAAALGWQRLAVLPVRAGPEARRLLAGFGTALGAALMPAALPEVPQIAAGAAAQFYDLDYRDVGRLTYAPLRDASDAAWRGLAEIITGLGAKPVPD